MPDTASMGRAATRKRSCGPAASTALAVTVTLTALLALPATASAASVRAASAASGAASARGIAPATTAAGTLRAWGYDFYGELGNGSTTSAATDTPVTVRLPRHTKVTAVSSSCVSSLALTTSGQVLAWGFGGDGELGDRSLANRDTPVRVRLPRHTKVKAIGAGCESGLALSTSGRVLDWGGNTYGQLGNGSTHGSDVPVTVHLPKGTKIKAVSAGCDFSLALTTNDRLLAWGDDAYGELGDGGPVNRHTPVMVRLPRGTKVSAISAGCFQGFVLTTTGSVLAWGDDSDGQLGNGTIAAIEKPVKVKLPRGTKVRAVSSGQEHTLALTTAGHVLAWGLNAQGELGIGGTGSGPVDRPVSVRLPRGTKTRAVSAGYLFSLALTTAGRALAWGYNQFGQLGDGTGDVSYIPVRVKLPADVIAIAAAQGGQQSFAIMR